MSEHDGNDIGFVISYVIKFHMEMKWSVKGGSFVDTVIRNRLVSMVSLDVPGGYLQVWLNLIYIIITLEEYIQNMV
jgi:hypothetical protein